MKKSVGIKGMAVMILLLFLLVSCNNPVGPDDENNVGDVSESLLGRGYDVFDPYAEPNYVMDRVLDFDALYGDGVVEIRSIETANFKTVSGSTYEEYLTDWGVSVGLSGSYKFFSASLETSFSQSDFSSSLYEFATVQARIGKTAHIIEGRSNIDMLRNYLDADFAAAVNDLEVSPEELFGRFGTHALTAIVNGARMDYNYSANTSSASTSIDIGIAAQVAFDAKFVSAGISTEFNYGQDYASEYENVYEETSVLGGASEYGLGIHTDGQYQDWVATISDNMVFCDFFGDNGLVPIWELADSQDRRDEIAAAFEGWAVEREVSYDVVEGESVLTDTEDVSFIHQGFTSLILGDGDVHTSSGRETAVLLDIKLSGINDTQNRPFLLFDIFLRVEEVGGDATTYSGRARYYYALPEGREVVGIESARSYYYNGNIDDKQLSWVELFPDPTGQLGTDDIRVMIDSSSGIDLPYIGVRFINVGVEYQYVELN